VKRPPGRQPATAGLHATAESIHLPTDWSAEQALAVFEILDELRERVWGHYGPQIQQALREQHCTTPIAAADRIEDSDVPF